MGPGDFAPFECTGTNAQPRGWVSVHGSGPETTRFVRTDAAGGFKGACAGGIEIRHCDGMEFHDVGAYGQTGVEWAGAGQGVWSNVDMVAELVPGVTCGGGGALGWYDVEDTNDPSDKSLHYFFGCRVISKGGTFYAIAFDSTHAENWFYGGDILSEPSTAFNSFAVQVSAGDLRAFGATVRARPSATMATATAGAEIVSGAFHMHGGIINVDGSGSSQANLWGIRANGASSFAHTPGTAFVLKPAAAGTTKRIEEINGAQVQSPFLWPAGTTPPAPDSTDGSDLFVDTNAGASGGESHLMVRDSSCTAPGGPWRDMATGACRP